ncbi:MAG: type II toxin-antitoxin system VapC family toxin [Deltaproteobacteria bacterium]|nr:type II toxin-antitoxin system VapC family toxin [Deltaproteobacteria bacterium]
MLYVDTSVIVKLYVKETLSREVASWIRANNEAIPLTLFHDLEFNNAVQLKQFRSEITHEEAITIASTRQEHEDKGIYYRPSINWAEAFQCGIDLSREHTGTIGSRSLDILHIASALTMKADRFLTLDERQMELALLVGLKLEKVAD